MDYRSYRCGGFYIDPDNRRFKSGDVDVVLEHKVFAVILQLLQRPGALVTRNELLDAVWGHRFVTPSTLNRVIALARRAFGDNADKPTLIQTVHGAGYRFIGQVEVVAPALPEVRARFAPPVVARLPARVEALIGRETELELIPALLAEHRAVTVLGTGGMGKTVCAIEAARRSADSHPDGVWFFDLAPMRDADEWLQTLAGTMSIQAPGRESLLEKLCALLTGRRALLLLDNCDRVAAEVGAIVRALLRGTDQLQVLSTSQQPLRFVGEQLMRMPPLGLPDPADERGLDLSAIEAAPACALLLTRGRAVQPGFAVTQDNKSTIVEICQHLDGMPLALELAAARLALLSAEQVLERLTERFLFLASDAAGRDVRHRNLLALLGWSYNLLSPMERQYLAWLAVFVQGWTVEAAIDIAARLGQSASSAIDLLTGLVSKSLVTFDRTGESPRYRLLETVREFALEQLRDFGDEERARAAHLAYVRSLSAAIERDVLAGRIRERIPVVVHEDGNIASAIEHACTVPGGQESALAIVGSLTLYLKGRGNYNAGMLWCDLALSGANASELPAAARTLLCKGVLTTHAVTQQTAAESALLAAGKLARISGDHWAEAYASGYHALLLANSGRLAAAVRLEKVTTRLAEELDDALLLGLAGLVRGWISLARGEYRKAIAALISVQGLGPDLHQQHFIEIYLGLAYFALGAWQQAAQHMLAALRAAADYRNMRGMAGSVEGCGYIAVERGLYSEGVQLLGSAARIRDRTSVPLFHFWLVHHERAHTAAKRGLGGATYDADLAVGQQLRDEESVRRAAALLRSFAEDPPTDAQPIRS